MPQPKLFSAIDRAVYEYRMIEPGDRILVGASGGKDSTALIEYLANRARRKGAAFSYTALHVQSEITPPLPDGIRSLFSSWGVPLASLSVDVLGRLKPERRMSCWWCSTQRRTELLRYALEGGYTKLALGHHLDDILETFLMNALHKGELSTMPPRLAYKNYPLVIIRPLCHAPVGLIREHCAERGYAAATCTCTYQDNSGRKDARARLDALTGGSDVLKAHLFSALGNVKPEYLP